VTARSSGRGLRGVACLLALALLGAGCGDSALWARWRAERGSWRARRLVERIEINPRLAGDADWARAAAACRAVVAAFPAAVWTERARAGSPVATDVLASAGGTALLAARLDESRERPGAALEGYERVRREYRAAPAVALGAAVARARLLARLGRSDEAEGAWIAIARDYPAADPRSGTVLDAVLDAPLIVARAWRARGDVAGADSLVRAAERACLELVSAQRGRPAAPGLWSRVGEARSALGDPAGAREALRRALGDPAGVPVAPQLVLALARRALDDGPPDTALAYARWAANDFEGAVRPAALLVAASAWRAGGHADSALAVYEQVVEEGADPDAAIRARYERARLLEELGRWDQARGEYHALAGAAPTHPLAFESMVRVVRHHLERGERGLGMTEAQHALGALDALIASQQDDAVQVRAGATRVRLLLETGDDRGAGSALAALLRRYPEAPLDAGLLMSTAEAAERRPEQMDLAIEFYRAAAVRAVDPESRRRARAAADRLAGAQR